MLKIATNWKIYIEICIRGNSNSMNSGVYQWVDIKEIVNSTTTYKMHSLRCYTKYKINYNTPMPRAIMHFV